MTTHTARQVLITQSDALPDDPTPRIIFRHPLRCSLHTAEPSDGGTPADYAWLVLPSELPLPWGAQGPVTLSLNTLDGQFYGFELSAHTGELDLSDPTDVRLRFHGWGRPVVKSFSGYLH